MLMEKKKKNWGSSTYRISNKIDFKTKAIQKRQGRTLRNDTGNNPTRGYNPSKHLCTNTGAPKYVKHILMDIKGEIDRNT